MSAARLFSLVAAIGLLAACSSPQPLPPAHAAVSIWDVSPMSSALRQSGGGAAYRFTATGPERRGIASMRLYDLGQADVEFFFPDFKSLDNFSAATQGIRFECGTQRLESGVQYACQLNGKAAAEPARVTVVTDGIQVLVPAGVFADGKPVQLQWLEYWR